MKGGKGERIKEIEVVVIDKEIDRKIFILRCEKPIIVLNRYPDEEMRLDTYFLENFAKTIYNFLAKNSGQPLQKVNKLDLMVDTGEICRFPKPLNDKPFEKDIQEVMVPIE